MLRSYARYVATQGELDMHKIFKRQTLMRYNELQSQQGDQGMQCHKPHPGRCLKKQTNTYMYMNKHIKKNIKADV